MLVSAGHSIEFVLMDSEVHRNIVKYVGSPSLPSGTWGVLPNSVDLSFIPQWMVVSSG